MKVIIEPASALVLDLQPSFPSMSKQCLILCLFSIAHHSTLSEHPKCVKTLSNICLAFRGKFKLKNICVFLSFKKIFVIRSWNEFLPENEFSSVSLDTHCICDLVWFFITGFYCYPRTSLTLYCL